MSNRPGGAFSRRSLQLPVGPAPDPAQLRPGPYARFFTQTSGFNALGFRLDVFPLDLALVVWFGVFGVRVGWQSKARSA